MAVAPRMYARSLFAAAKEQDRLEAVLDELAEFVTALDDAPGLRNLLTNPQIDSGERVEALREILQGADELVRNFLLLVTEKGRGGQVEEIYREYDALVAAEQKRLTVELTTAYELSDGEAAEILKRIEKSSGRAVEATRKVDPALIGGIVLQAGSLRVDASVKGRIDRLRHELARS